MELSEEIHSALAFSRVSAKKSKELVTAFGNGALALLLRARQTCIYPKLMKNKLDSMVKNGFMTDYSSYKEAFDHSSKLDYAVVFKNDFFPKRSYMFAVAVSVFVCLYYPKVLALQNQSLEIRRC
jgi:hypothetical protein